MKYYNYENLKKSKVIYITGMSGAGKSTLTSNISKYKNLEIIELDDLFYFKFIKIIKQNKDPYKYLLEQYKFIINKIKNMNNKIVIIEGLQLSKFSENSKVKVYDKMLLDNKIKPSKYKLDFEKNVKSFDKLLKIIPTIFVETSYLKSSYRRYQRDGKGLYALSKNIEIRKALFHHKKLLDDSNAKFKIIDTDNIKEIFN